MRAFAVTVVLSLIVLFWPSAPSSPLFPSSDKVVHAALFAALAITGSRAGLPRVGLGLGLACYAGLSELIQSTLPHRSASGHDVLADLAGVLIGLVIANRFVVLKGQPRRLPPR